MRIMPCAVLVAAGAGCAQLFAIDPTSGPGDVELDLQRVSIGAAVVTTPLALASTPAFLDDTGAEIAATPGAPGTWTAELDGEPAVLYTAPDLPVPYLHVFAFPTRTTRADFTAFEHPDPEPAPATDVVLNVALPAPYAATDALEIDAIGAWTQHVLAGAELPAAGATAVTSTIPYSSFAATANGPPARISSMDRVVVVRYTGQTLTGAATIPAFDQSDAGADTLTAAMTAVTADTPFDAAVDPTTAAARFGALGFAGVDLAWTVSAAPGASVGAVEGVQLAGGAVAATDTSFSSSYGDPFTTPPWPAMLTYAATGTRTAMLGGAPVTLVVALQSLLAPVPGMVLDFPVGLATATLDGSALTDGILVAIDPAQEHAIDLTADQPADEYSAHVDELVVTGGSVTRTIIVAVDGPTPHLTLPPNVLQRGHTYVIATSCITGGLPNAASGDLQTFAFPIHLGLADGAVFTIAP